MLLLDADRIRALVSTPRLIEALRDTFRRGGITAVRTPTEMPGGASGRLFVSMLAIDQRGPCVVKLLTILPENRAKGLLTVQAAIVVFSEEGKPTALLDGTVVTHLRTGAASALASQYLSREDSSHLVLIGTGALAPTMAASHCAVRPIKRISVCGRRPDRVAATGSAIRSLVSRDIEMVLPPSIEEAVRSADIVSCATSSPTPVLLGKWLKPGAHVDLVGSFQPTKRESDDDVVVRSRIFVDTFEGALHEGGDVVEPLSRGIITRKKIEGDLAALILSKVPGRASDSEITMFKSVGSAIEDFAAARLLTALAEGTA